MGLSFSFFSIKTFKEENHTRLNPCEMGVFIWANEDQHSKLVETKELQRKVWGGEGKKLDNGFSDYRAENCFLRIGSLPGYYILFGMIKRARIVKPHFSYKKLTYYLLEGHLWYMETYRSA